jgi:hypothetical protein
MEYTLSGELLEVVLTVKIVKRENLIKFVD